MIQISELASCGVDEGYLRACLSAYQAGEVTIAVTGEFSSGKSCFLNALAGRPGLLPEGDTECTPIYIELSSGPSDRLSVLSRDGALLPEAFAPQTIEKYARYTRDYTGGALALHLSLEGFPLNSRIHIIDCPGTNTVIKEHEQITGQVLKKCDAVIYAANKTLTEADLQRIQAISRRSGRMLFLLTHMDEASGAADLPQETVDKYLTEARALLAQRLGIGADQVPLYPIGSKRALENRRLLTPVIDALNTIAQTLDEKALRRETKKRILMYLNGLAEEEQRRIDLLSAANAQDRAALERRLASASRKLEAMKRQDAPAGAADGSEEARRFGAKLDQIARNCTGRVVNKIKVAPTFDIEAISALAAQNVERFDQEAERALRECVSAMGEREFKAVAEELSALADEAELPMAELLLLTPPDFSDQDSIDCARVRQLQRQIDQCDKEIGELEEERVRESMDAAARSAALEQRRQDKAALRQELHDLGGYTPEYRTIHEEGAEAAGAKVGRILGEVADLALLVWNPAGGAAVEGAKAAGEGAKAAGEGIKILDKAKDALKTAHYAAAYASGLVDDRNEKGKKKSSALAKIANLLDKVSLGGIGENIGEKIGGLIAPSRDIQVEDQEARQRYFDSKRQLEQQIQDLSQEIRREEYAVQNLLDPGEKKRQAARLSEKRQMLEQKQELQRQQNRAQAENQADQNAREDAAGKIAQYFAQHRQNCEKAVAPVFQQAGALLAQEAGKARQLRIADAEHLLAQLDQEKETLLAEIRLRETVLAKLKAAQESVDGWLAAPEAR